MTAEEAKDYGLVDEVVKSRKELPAAVQETTGGKIESSGAAPAEKTE